MENLAHRGSDSISQYEVVHLAITDNSAISDMSLKEFDELQSAIIIHSGTQEPAHFMQCIEERLCYFVRSPKLLKDSLQIDSRWTNFMKDQKCIFKKVDSIDDQKFCKLKPEEMRSFLRGYNIVFFTLYSGFGSLGGHDQIVINTINDLIDRGELSVVFLRGSGVSVPMKLGFITRKENDGYVEFADGNHVELLLENINQLDNHSLSIFVHKCMDKLEQKSITFGEVEETVENCLRLEDSYICGICDTSLTKASDWHFLAKGVHERNKYPWAVHKTKKVMFTPWYGYSHGNENQCLLTLYALRYLLHEHGKPLHNIANFKSNLLDKTTNNQLSDISINLDW